MGTRGKPFYRLVVADSRAPRDGRFIETVGYYDPRTEPPTVKIDEEKALLWLSRGAQPTETAGNLLQKQSILSKFAELKTKATQPSTEANTNPSTEEVVQDAEGMTSDH